MGSLRGGWPPRTRRNRPPSVVRAPRFARNRGPCPAGRASPIARIVADLDPGRGAIRANSVRNADFAVAPITVRRAIRRRRRHPDRCSRASGRRQSFVSITEKTVSRAARESGGRDHSCRGARGADPSTSTLTLEERKCGPKAGVESLLEERSVATPLAVEDHFF